MSLPDAHGKLNRMGNGQGINLQYLTCPGPSELWNNNKIPLFIILLCMTKLVFVWAKKPTTQKNHHTKNPPTTQKNHHTKNPPTTQKNHHTKKPPPQQY